MIRTTVRSSIALMILATAFVATIDCATSMAQSSSEQRKNKAVIPFKVISRSEVRGEKLSFEVRVDLVGSRLPTKDELDAVSAGLVKGQGHKRKFVGFYLPDMPIDAGYFATAHHLPTMEVKILKFNLPEKYRKLVKE